jgi:hypothetical protein
MALLCEAFFEFYDNQHRTHTFSVYITPPASMGAGVDLVTQAKLVAIANAIIDPTGAGVGSFSDAQLLKYGQRIIQTDLTGINIGIGSSPIKSFTAFRSGIGTVGKVDPFGDEIGIEVKIPGTNQEDIIFSNQDRNAVSTVGDNWTALRTALVAAGFQDENGTVLTSSQIAQEAQYFLGKAGLMRPR